MSLKYLVDSFRSGYWYSHETSGSIKGTEFLVCLGLYWHLQKKAGYLVNQWTNWFTGSLSRVVGKRLGLRAGPPRVRIPIGAKSFLFSKSSRCPSSLLFHECHVSFPGVKRPEREVNYLPPFSAGVKKEWIHASTPHVCLHGLDRGNFILLLVRGVTFLTYIWDLPTSDVIWGGGGMRCGRHGLQNPRGSRMTIN
jgi:hypothetical protein